MAPKERRRGARSKTPSARPPPVVPAGLSPDQRATLACHLARELEPGDADRLLFAVAHWFGYGPRAATAVAEHEANLRRTHFARMERAAVELQEALRLEAPLWRTAGLDWRNLDALLGRVQTSARAEAACPGSRNGAPPLRWRDELIALVRVHYPASKLKVSWVSHFEETIRLLLEFLGVELQDLHKQVRRTLDRHPASPFVVDDESNVVRLPAPSRRT